MDILKNVMYDYVKTARPYVEPTVQDAQKIEDKIKQENDEFLKRATDFNKFNIAATIKEEQFLWWIFDVVIDLPDNRQIIDDRPTAEEIFIDDNLFSENDIEDDHKQIIDNILKDINYDDILMQYTQPQKNIKIEQKTRETLNLKDTLLPKKEKIIVIFYK